MSNVIYILDGTTVNLSTQLNDSSERYIFALQLIYLKHNKLSVHSNTQGISMQHTDNDLSVLRHSAAHLLAHAVSQLFPGTQLTIGPATKDGFFYDFLPTTTFKEEDLTAIATRMSELAAHDYAIKHEEISKEEARKRYAHNPFKLELIDGIPGDTVGLSTQGDFYDLCRGGHVASTGALKHFKLLNVSGAYWRADKNNQALQRISGTAFFSAEELKAYEELIENAKKYDHRKLGKQLDLFSFHDEGPGFPFYHPKGMKVAQILKDSLRTELDASGYQEIATPTMLTDDLWRQSGHYAHYKDNMYFCEIENRFFAIKPMNCPGSILIYKSQPHSYRELPIRYAEFGQVHRFELSGVLHGMFRARAFTIDDAHIYCMVDQLQSEIVTMIKLTMKVLKRFSFSEINVKLSTRPDNAMGSDELWQKATDALSDGLKAENVSFDIQEGEGAFYGPKIEFHIKDSMGRSWQCGTIQVDFFQPENFDLSYIASSGKKERPVIVHRAIYGSLERFFGILLEHFKGNLPFWLAPVQIKMLTITDEQQAYAEQVYGQLFAAGLRVEIDTTSDTISSKIKNAQLEKVPMMLVIGQKEVDANTVTIRYNDGKQEFGITIPALLEKTKTLNTID